MKNFLVILFLSSPVYAQDICEDYGRLGDNMMSYHQDGMTDAELKDFFGPAKNSSLYEYYPDGYMKFALREIKTYPVFNNEDKQEKAREEFSEMLEMVCYDAEASPIELE